MSEMNLSRIQEALAVIEEEGRKGYKPECRAGIPRYRAIGLALARVNDSARDCVQLAYAWLEDWNYHDLCAVLEWAYPIFGQTFHKSDLQRLERMMNKRGVTILAEWNAEKTDYDSKVIDARLVFEDVKEE